MKFWQSTAFNDARELPEIAKAAEAAGFEGVLVSDHLFVPVDYEPGYLYSESGRPDFDTSTPFPDPWVTIATMAAHTTRLRFQSHGLFARCLRFAAFLPGCPVVRPRKTRFRLVVSLCRTGSVARSGP
jgi:hypothetical protein